jgi:hypothetical protein
MTFEPESILSALVTRGVRFVLIGGFAARMHGSGLPTQDVDVSPEMTETNLVNLIEVLGELDACIRVAGLPEGLPFDTSPEALQGTRLLNLVTRFGDLDLVIEPAGTGGYQSLIEEATAMTFDNSTLMVASLGDLITSKEAAGRPKDLRALPRLEQLRIDAGGSA